MVKERGRKVIEIIVLLCGLAGCTSQHKERIPDSHVMHLPFTMAQNGPYLAVSASDADGKYEFGRLVTLDKRAIKTAIEASDSKTPIEWSKVVATNVLIPEEIGEINFSDNFIVFPSRENNQIYALPVVAGLPKCNDPSLNLASCDSASSLALSSNDPYAIQTVVDNPKEAQVLVSFLSSDRIDVVKIDKTKTSNVLGLTKSLYALDFLRTKLDAQSIKDRRFITRKIHVTFRNDTARSKAYFLFEQHPEKVLAPTRSKAAFIAAISVSDLLADGPVSDGMIELWDLEDRFSIASALDLFVDEVSNEAYVLGRVPEILFKLDLNTRTIMETRVVCTGATSMAVSNDLIVVPCFKDNRVASYSRATLGLKAVSRIVGRGPSYVVIDEPNKLIYCSYNNDGTLVIFDDKLNYLGYVFNKAPSNRIGS